MSFCQLCISLKEELFYNNTQNWNNIQMYNIYKEQNKYTIIYLFTEYVVYKIIFLFTILYILQKKSRREVGVLFV